ncbi:hypothetical protein HK098_000984 [Nowakowskiella sp. JEL0407]|nr:hypothetical protein HK098_000984 [Nowakowskiella sp. JEL0407]
MVRQRAQSTVSQKSLYNPNQQQLPPEPTEFVDMPDTFNLIHKALDQYEGLNNQTQDLNTIEHEMEVKQKEMGATEKKIHDLMVEINAMEEELYELNGVKLRQLQGNSFKMITAKMKGSLSEKVSKESLARERLLAELENHKVKVAALREEWQDLHILHEVLKQQKEEFKWVRDEMEILLGQVFDGPSPDFPQEDDMEEEVAALTATCKRLEDQFQKYRKTEGYVMEAQSFLERSISHLRDAKVAVSQGDRDMGRAVDKLLASRRASQEAYAAVEAAAAIISGFAVVLDRFAPPLSPEDAGFFKSNNIPSECFRLTEFAHDHIRTQTIVKLSLSRAAKQLPTRAQDTLNQLMAEQEELEKAKKIHIAFRKQIVDNVFWEQKEMEKLESDLDDVDFSLDEVANSNTGSTSNVSTTSGLQTRSVDTSSITSLPARRARASSNNLTARPQNSEDDFTKVLRRAFKENDSHGRSESIDLGRLTSVLGVSRRSEDDERSIRSHKSAMSLRAALMPPPYEQITPDNHATSPISPPLSPLSVTSLPPLRF